MTKTAITIDLGAGRLHRGLGFVARWPGVLLLLPSDPPHDRAAGELLERMGPEPEPELAVSTFLDALEQHQLRSVGLVTVEDDEFVGRAAGSVEILVDGRTIADGRSGLIEARWERDGRLTVRTAGLARALEAAATFDLRHGVTSGGGITLERLGERLDSGLPALAGPSVLRRAALGSAPEPPATPATTAQPGTGPTTGPDTGATGSAPPPAAPIQPSTPPPTPAPASEPRPVTDEDTAFFPAVTRDDTPGPAAGDADPATTADPPEPGQDGTGDHPADQARQTNPSSIANANGYRQLPPPDPTEFPPADPATAALVTRSTPASEESRPGTGSPPRPRHRPPPAPGHREPYRSGVPFRSIRLDQGPPLPPLEPLPVATDLRFEPPSSVPAGRGGHPAPAHRQATDRDVVEAELGPLPPSVVVVRGIICSRQHFNNPLAAYCMVCGISMVHVTHRLVPGPRPTLGFLVFDDGSTFGLDRGYIVGREPGQSDDPTMSPLAVHDHNETLSRRHADIQLTDWTVTVTDRGSTNGTFVWDATHDRWHRIPPNAPSELAPGATVALGRRTFVFESVTRF
ncbi:MAG: FHA domain-containing protein [Acidimicrobiales bacterium]